MTAPNTRTERTLDCAANLIGFGAIMAACRFWLSFTGWEAIAAGVFGVLLSRPW